MEYCNDKYQSECEKYCMGKKIIVGNSWNASTSVYENSRYLKSIVDDSVIVRGGWVY